MKTNISNRKCNIPIQIVTNGGGDTEFAKSNQFSSTLGLSPKNKLKEREIILSHTPIREALSYYSTLDKSKVPLVLHCSKLHEIMKYYQIKRYITDIEYALIFKHIVPNNSIRCYFPMRKQLKAQAERRLGMKLDSSKPIAINSIFQITEVLHWEIPAQLCCDLMISTNGIPGTKRKDLSKQLLTYHIANPDTVYQDVFTLPRYCSGTFLWSLLHLYKRTHNASFEYVQYGKPNKTIFDFAKRRIAKQYPNRKISRYYMIGDNPDVDIKGANDLGITSVLVRTGIFTGKGNDKRYPAKIVCDNVYEGVKEILNREKILI